MALDWQTNVDLWTGQYGADYDWGTGWEDEWKKFQDWVTGSSPGSYGVYQGDFDQPSPNRPMWEAGTQMTQDAFKAAYDAWVQANPQEAPMEQPTAADYGADGTYMTVKNPGGWSETYWIPGEAIRADSNWGKPGTIDNYDYISRIGTLASSTEKQYGELQALPGLYEERGLTSFQDWMDQQGYQMGDVSGIQSQLAGLSDLLQSGGEADRTAAAEYAAGKLGMTDQEYQDMIGRLSGQLTADDAMAQMTGLSPEEMQMRERYKANELQRTQQSMNQMLDNVLASSGSRAQYLQRADQAMEQVRDQAIQYDMAIMQEDSERRSAEFDRKMQMWGNMVQMNQMSESQFLANVRADRSLAMQSLAMQASNILNENQQYLSMFGSDLNALNSYVQTEFNRINAEMGLENNAINQASEMYAQLLAPYETALAEYDLYLDQLAIDQQDILNQQLMDETTATQTTNTITSVLDIGLKVLGTILMFVPGGQVPGALFGGTSQLLTGGGGYVA
jgi:hypothetical protein